MLAGEQMRVVELRRHHPLRRPLGLAAVRHAGFVDDRVDRVAGERGVALNVVQERRRIERKLQQVVQALGAVAHAEHVADLPKPSPGQPVAGRQPQRVIVDRALQVQQSVAVARVALQISPVAFHDAPVCVGVVLVDGVVQWGEAARDERLSQTVRGQRQIRGHAEPAEALPEHAPPLHAELAPNPFGVADDRIGPEMREVVGLLLRAHPGKGSDRRRAPRAALIEHQHAELL